jgi:transketolase
MRLTESVEELEKIALQMRRNVIEMGHVAGSRGAHFGPALSSIEILACLYFSVMHHDPADPHMSDRDRFVMSKGHACLSYYAALARAGYITKEDMATFKADDSFLAGHPSLNMSYGLEVSTGSLGNGFAVACGMAQAAKIKQQKHTVFCLVGDGECNEGLIWEAAMNAAKNRLSNLVALVDNNGVQLAGKTAEIMDVNLENVWRAFGWDVMVVEDGNDVVSVRAALQQMKDSDVQKPHMIIAKTVKGKGISFMEDSIGWHASPINDEQYRQAITDLEDK